MWKQGLLLCLSIHSSETLKSWLDWPLWFLWCTRSHMNLIAFILIPVLTPNSKPKLCILKWSVCPLIYSEMSKEMHTSLFPWHAQSKSRVDLQYGLWICVMLQLKVLRKHHTPGFMLSLDLVLPWLAIVRVIVWDAVGSVWHKEATCFPFLSFI